MEGKIMNKKLMIGVIALFVSVVLAACGGNDNNNDTNNDSSEDMVEKEESDNPEGEDDSSMNMDPSSSGEIPDDLANADDPTYPIDSEAEINADHMKGMNGAVATIEGAYDTIAYEVTYTPKDGGEKVENHKRSEERRVGKERRYQWTRDKRKDR